MVNKLKSRIPYLGNNQALKNHIANALRNAGDLNVVIKNIDAIPKENMDSLTKTGLEKFKNEIIPEVRQIIKETQGETAEQGSKLEQAGAKQEVVKGEAKNQQFNNTNVDYTSAVKNIVERKELALRLDPKADILSVVKDSSKPIKTPIFTSKISFDKMLNHLADKIDGDRRLEYINLVKPTLEKPLFITQESISGAQRFRFFKTFIDEKDKVVKFLNVVEDKNGELIEITATPIKNTDLKNLLKGKVIWGGDTLSDLSTPQTAKQGSEADKAIISQNAAKDELKSLSKEYDVEQFLKDRENILAKDTRYGKTRFSDARVEDNGGVGGWEYKRAPAGYDKNYKADFLTTKAYVAKIRGGKIDEQTLGKLKQDLESSEYLGYEYKKTHKNNGADEYADEEFFRGAPVEAKGGHSAAAAIEEQRFAGTGRDKNTIMYANPHVGTGLAGGTLNAKDENGNFDAEKFAKGFIYGLFGSKVTAATLKKTNPKLYDQIVNIGKDKAGKEKISSFVNKLKQDELGKLLQKTITNKDLSTKTKVEIIEAAKKRFAKETPKSLNGQSEAQMSESALKAKENNLKIDDVSNDAKEKWIKTFGLKSIDDDFIPNLKPEVKKAIKDKEIRLTKGSLLKIVARGREKYIPLIRQSLEDTDMVLKDEGTFLFVKEMDDKSLVFTSVGRNFDTHITIISNAPKKINNIKNKLMNKAEIVYRSSKLRTTPL